MDRQLILHELMQEEFDRCSTLYKTLTDKYLELPKGSLLDRNGRIYRAFRENGKQYQKPIKNDIVLHDNLKLRRHIKMGLPTLKGRMDACKNFLIQEQMYDPYIIENKLSPLYRSGGMSVMFLEDDINIAGWENAEYRRNPMEFKEEHYTAGGRQVRSKSEALIGTVLEERGISFRCEPELELEDKIIYPDFEILLKNRRRIVYLEHFGKMDDPKYLESAMNKIEKYSCSGLIPGFNFFFTWETKDKPLNLKEINIIIEEILRLDK